MKTTINKSDKAIKRSINESIARIELSYHKISGSYKDIGKEIALIKGLTNSLQGEIQITDLNFSTRTYRFLVKLGVHTLEELQRFKSHELLKERNCGDKTYSEIMFMMLNYGLRFRKNTI